MGLGLEVPSHGTKVGEKCRNRVAKWPERNIVGRLEGFVEQPPNATEFGQGFEKEVTG